MTSNNKKSRQLIISFSSALLLLASGLAFSAANAATITYHSAGFIKKDDNTLDGSSCYATFSVNRRGDIQSVYIRATTRHKFRPSQASIKSSSGTKDAYPRKPTSENDKWYSVHRLFENSNAPSGTWKVWLSYPVPSAGGRYRPGLDRCDYEYKKNKVGLEINWK